MSKLPEGWASLQLKEIAKRGGGSVNPSSFPDRTFELYSVPSFSQGSPEIVPGAEVKSSKQLVQEGDVLLCKIVPHLNRVWTVGPKGEYDQIASGEWIIYRDHECEPDYLRYLMSEPSFRARFLTTKVGVGGSLTRASPKQVNEFEVPIAPRPEQKRIAAKIDSLTAKSARARTELTKIEALVERYKAAVVDHELTSVSAISQRCTIEELAENIRYGTSKKSEYNVGKTPVLRIPNIVSGSVDISDLKYGDFDAAELEKLSLRPGDMLFIRSNGSVNLVGRSAVVAEDQARYLFAGYLIRVRFDLDRVDPSYVQLWFSAPKQRETIERLARSTSGVNNINSKQIQALKITIPPLEVQRSVVQRANARLQLIERLKSECVASHSRLASLDGAVLKKAFEGDLVRQNPADEPALVLLKRIRLAKQQKVPRRRPRRKLVDVNDHAAARREQMAKTLLEALTNTGDWMDAQSLFSAVGIKNGSSTDTVELFYAELRALDEDGLIEWEPVLGGDGKKVTDRIRLKEPAKA